MNELATKIAEVRQALVAGRHEATDDLLLAVEGDARRALLGTGGSRGFFGRVFAFDPATLAVIFQLVLLVLELVRKSRKAA